MRSCICSIVAVGIALLALGCGESKQARGPTPEQQKATDDEMKKLVDRANKKK